MADSEASLVLVALKDIFVLCPLLSSLPSTLSHSSSSLLASSCSTLYPRTQRCQGPVQARKTLQKTLLNLSLKARRTEPSVGFMTDTVTETNIFYLTENVCIFLLHCLICSYCSSFDFFFLKNVTFLLLWMTCSCVSALTLWSMWWPPTIQ